MPNRASRAPPSNAQRRSPPRTGGRLLSDLGPRSRRSTACRVGMAACIRTWRGSARSGQTFAENLARRDQRVVARVERRRVPRFGQDLGASRATTAQNELAVEALKKTSPAELAKIRARLPKGVEIELWWRRFFKSLLCIRVRFRISCGHADGRQTWPRLPAVCTPVRLMHGDAEWALSIFGVSDQCRREGDKAPGIGHALVATPTEPWRRTSSRSVPPLSIPGGSMRC